MKHEPVKDHAERKRIFTLIERCEKEQTMELITINPNNEPYYSEDFIKGFKCGAQRQLEADRASIKTKQIKYYDEDEKVWKTGNVIVEQKEQPQVEIPEYAEWKEPFEKMTDCPWK